MSIKISVKKNINQKQIKNFVLFADDDFNIRGLSKISLPGRPEIINKTIKT